MVAGILNRLYDRSFAIQGRTRSDSVGLTAASNLFMIQPCRSPACSRPLKRKTLCRGKTKFRRRYLTHFTLIALPFTAADAAPIPFAL